MAKSNTRIFASQKAWAKEQKRTLRNVGGDVFHFTSEGVTAAIRPKFAGSEFVEVSVAIMSESEKKYRKSVGAYYALCRLEDGNYITIRRGGWDLESIAHSIACIIVEM